MRLGSRFVTDAVIGFGATVVAGAVMKYLHYLCWYRWVERIYDPPAAHTALFRAIPFLPSAVLVGFLSALGPGEPRQRVIRRLAFGPLAAIILASIFSKDWINMVGIFAPLSLACFYLTTWARSRRPHSRPSESV